MSKTLALILIVLAFIGGAVVGVLGYIFVTGGDGTPSRDISEVAESNQIVSDDNTSEAGIRYQINPEVSEARFAVDEELRGQPMTTIGITNQIAGEVLIDFENPTQSQVSNILVNARTLNTDEEFRNRALRSGILKSAEDEFEFIEFVPKQLNGLPETANVGDEISFQIVGDLTVTGVTQEVVFEVTATATSEDELVGIASTQVLYPDFGLVIPSVQNVANVAEEVLLEINFIASRVVE